MSTLPELAGEIFSCPSKDCPYRQEFDRTYGMGRRPQWLFWGPNEYPFARCAKTRTYIPIMYDGVTKVMFIAPRPSTEEYPGRADLFFMDVLFQIGLVKPWWKVEEDAFVYYKGPFITDLIKCRGRARAGLGPVPRQCIHFLKKEIKTIDPELVIALGIDSFNTLREWRDDLGIGVRVVRTYHYAYPFRFRKEKMLEKMRKVRENIANLLSMS